MLRKWPCREKSGKTSPKSHSPGNSDIFNVDLDSMILMVFSNLNYSMISTINATSVHPFGGESKLILAILVFIQFFMLFLSAVKRKTAMITFPANTLLTHDTGKMQRIRNAFPGCSGNSKTWEYEKVLPSFVQNLTRVLRCVYNFLCFFFFPIITYLNIICLVCCLECENVKYKNRSSVFSYRIK